MSSLEFDARKIVSAYYDHVDDGDVDALVDLFADDVCYERPGRNPIEGIDELREFYEAERRLEDGTHEIERVIVDGRHVAVRGRFSGVQGGEAVGFGFADHHEFDGEGRITNRWTYTDRDAI